MERLTEYLTEPGDIILDCFAGAGTTAHGVLLANRSDNGLRKFVCVQLPEPILDDTETGRNALSIGCKNVADICKERVRRVITQFNQEDSTKLPLGGQITEDRGFRVLKLTTSNFTVWNASTDTTDTASLEQQLELHTDHILPGRISEDLLYEILLKSGFPPTTPIEILTLADKTVYNVKGYEMLICLDKQLTHETIKAIAERKPGRVVCLDEGFAGNDQLKANAVLIMKAKGVTKFQTI